MFGRDEKVLTHLYGDRLLAIFDMARAMRYLHYKKVIYRDLKPENIGFDVRGDVRIFDFGLARELKPKDLVEPPDGYDCTGMTGSRRYMAPECVRCLPYGFSADVYSFAILMWQIFALKTPFPNFDSKKHFDVVVQRGKRPPVAAANLPSSMRRMMESSWAEEPSRRPDFVAICQEIQVEINRVGADGTHLSDRSKFLADMSISSLLDLEK
jgi:serine/threonine protein kinase